jgi:RNA recognition motif-containing protein
LLQRNHTANTNKNSSSLRSSIQQYNVSYLSLHLRGFAFVLMAKIEDSVKALETMDGFELDGRAIKVEKGRRKGAYEKTPGKCNIAQACVFMLFD